MMITVQAPASKSVSHRMVMGAALAQGDSVVSRVLESKDLERTMAILRGAGAGIVPVSYTHLRAHETVLDLVCRLLLEKNFF